MRAALLLLTGLAGCLPVPAESPVTTGDPSASDGAHEREGAGPEAGRRLPATTGNAWADCYRRFQPGEDPVADLARLGEACAAPGGLRPVGEPHQGSEQGPGDPPERLRFHARPGCYRAFAIGGPGVTDLDVALYDPAGRIAAGDVSRDRWPVVPPRGPLCVERAGVYTVAVAVTRGRGDYLLQIWSNGRSAE